MRKHGLRISPERIKVRTEQQIQQQQQGKKVPVVYYLCKNGHLEHPHFIEVPLSSNEGLYLRDVINRLNVLRGKKIASMYSWSCKRSYMNGFVWHDLAEDDLIQPVQGNEYVLKGSELLDQSPQDRRRNGFNKAKIHHDKHHQEASTSFSLNSTPEPPPPVRTLSAPVGQEDVSSPSTRRSGSSGEFYPELSTRTAPSSPCADIFSNRKSAAAHDASTQTDDIRNMANVGHTRITGVSTDDRSLDIHRESQQKPAPEIVAEKSSAAPISSSTSASWGTASTLESLIRDEIKRRNSFSVAEENFAPTRVKLKATDILIQLVSCGAIAAKDHYSLSFVPTHTTTLNAAKFPSPLASNSAVSGEIDLPESQRLAAFRQQEQYFTARAVGAKNYEETTSGVSDRRTSSFDGERSIDISSNKREKEKTVNGIQSRCLPRTLNIVSCKNSKNDMNDTPMSPVLDTKRTSVGSGCCGSSPITSSKMASNRIVDSSSVKGSSKRSESFREEKEKVTKIEERLTSGARIVIQCRSPCYDKDASRTD